MLNQAASVINRLRSFKAPGHFLNFNSENNFSLLFTFTLVSASKGDKRKTAVRDIVCYSIIYSTSINPLEKEKCMKLGAHTYLTKPVSIKESLDRAKFFLEFCEQHANPLPLDQSF